MLQRLTQCVLNNLIHCFFQVEREKSTGDGWFNMKAPEISQELKGDLQVLKMRGSLDPKRFYKKNDRDGFPKYFQVSKNCSSSTLFSNKAVYTFIFPARVCSWKQLNVDLFICNTHRNNT